MKEINLIGSQKRKQFGFSPKAKVFKTAAILINLVLVLVMGVFFFLYFNASQKLKRNEVKISLLKSEINKLDKKESFLVTIESRLVKIDGILNGKISLSDLLAKIKELFVEGYFFSSLEIKGQGKTTLTGSCLDNQCLSGLYAKTEEMKTKEPFSEIIYDSVSRRLNDPFEIGISLKK